MTVNMLNIVNNDGIILTIGNLSRLDEDSYAGVFIPPSEVFILQLLGFDGNGYHISDTSIGVTRIDLTLSMTVDNYYCSYVGCIATCVYN